jgi:hypothetical protein
MCSDLISGEAKRVAPRRIRVRRKPSRRFARVDRKSRRRPPAPCYKPEACLERASSL